MSAAATERLERYRAAKRAAREAEERRERLWDAATLGPVRRGLFGRRQERQQQVTRLGLLDALFPT